MRYLQEGSVLPSCSGVIGLRKKPNHYPVWSATIGALFFTFLLLTTSSCQLAQSTFARTTNNAGAAFSAASLTLSYAHQGKITDAYAHAAFANYQSELSGLDQQLPSQTGAPGPVVVHQLLSVYTPAMHVVNQPCLDASCDWHSQLAFLNQASEAFLKAGGQ